KRCVSCATPAGPEGCGTIWNKQRTGTAAGGENAPAASACRTSDTLQGAPISACCAGQKFLPPGILLGTKLSAEPRTRPCGLAHSQRSISLYVSRPSAHVGWTGLF